MAFTTVPGASNGDATSYLGTDGADSINLTDFSVPTVVNANGGRDSVGLSHASKIISNVTLRGGDGIDSFRIDDSVSTLNNSYVNGNANDDGINFQKIVSTTV